MQTEETKLQVLDDVPILNPSPDFEMTVKEEIEYPLELLEKANVPLDEYLSSSSSTKLIPQSENSSYFNDSIKANALNTSNIISSFEDKELNNNTQRNSKSLPHSVIPTSAATSPSFQQQNEKLRSRGRRRSRWKLKFHHQALPPEYLDHYEASMAQQEAAIKIANIKNESKGKTAPSSYTKSIPTVARKLSVSDKSEKFATSPTCIKIESDQVQSEPILTKANMTDQVNVLPLKSLTICSDFDSKSRVQEDVCCKEEINISNEKSVSMIGNINPDKVSQSKGLLGTLLASTITSKEIGQKTISDNEHKRKSVIIPSSNDVGTSGQSTSSINSGNGNKVMNYQDLPYMGEITLNNMKPRRGRKPKKADICHLIYKNYGTVFPGTAVQNNALDKEEWPRKKLQECSEYTSNLSSVCHSDRKLKHECLSECKPFEDVKQSSTVSHRDVHNRISSLLEKRLTSVPHEEQKNMYKSTYYTSPSSCFSRNDDEHVSHIQDYWNENSKRSINTTDEPLNLCIKDLNQLKIRLLRKHGNFYEPRTNDVIVKNEPPSPRDTEETNLGDLQAENETKFTDETQVVGGIQNNVLLRKEETETNNDFSESINYSHNSSSNKVITASQNAIEMDPNASPPLHGGYIYWPSAGVFVHPLALQSQFLCYQKMGAIPLVPLSSSEPQAFLPSIPQVNLISPMAPAILQPTHNNSPKCVQDKDQKLSISKIIPKPFSMIMDTDVKPSTSETPNEISFSRMKRLAPLGSPPNYGAPMKRKRSAIFIPPMPSENSTNPTTEVSICKFKFTGGAKPSLQEKKMLSVDSGGNFRYYSGTGDKSMRGYEFFPRETLQQSGATGISSSEQLFSVSSVDNGDEVIGNQTLPFVSDDNRTEQLKHLCSTIQMQSKPESQSSTSDLAKRSRESNSVITEQAQGRLVKKQSYLLTKGRCMNSVDSEKFMPVSSENDQSTHSQFHLRRKRKTRKSLAREKLEQTFKEKGFLIQTQQLESAEGATYCKFRQLRKFTRYLFRSWKDYLPGNVREMSVAAGVAGSQTSPYSESRHADSEVEEELSCSDSPTLSSHHLVSENSQQFSNI